MIQQISTEVGREVEDVVKTNVVNGLKGRIHIDTTVGKGTSFKIFLTR